MKKLHILATALLLLPLLASCGGGKSDPEPKPLADCTLGTSIIGECKI